MQNFSGISVFTTHLLKIVTIFKTMTPKFSIFDYKIAKTFLVAEPLPPEPQVFLETGDCHSDPIFFVLVTQPC